MWEQAIHEKMCFVTYTLKFLYEDHLWDCPKVVLKTTFDSPKGGP